MRSTKDYEAAFKSLGSERRTGIVQLGSSALVNPPTRFGDAALKYRLPTISFQKNLAMAGTLMAYGPNLEFYFPRAIILADKILKCAKPGELPIERPDRFQLIINRKTAKALGIEIPASLLGRADEVIEQIQALYTQVAAFAHVSSWHNAANFCAATNNVSSLGLSGRKT